MCTRRTATAATGSKAATSERREPGAFRCNGCAPFSPAACVPARDGGGARHGHHSQLPLRQRGEWLPDGAPRPPGLADRPAATHLSADPTGEAIARGDHHGCDRSAGPSPAAASTAAVDSAAPRRCCQLLRGLVAARPGPCRVQRLKRGGPLLLRPLSAATNAAHAWCIFHWRPVADHFGAQA